MTARLFTALIPPAATIEALDDFVEWPCDSVIYALGTQANPIVGRSTAGLALDGQRRGRGGRQPHPAVVRARGLGAERDGHVDGIPRRHQRAQEADQPPRPVLRPEQPDEGHNDDVEQRRIVGGVEWVGVVIAVGPLAATEQDGVHQLEPFALIVVERKAEELHGVDDVDDQVADERRQGQADEQFGQQVGRRTRVRLCLGKGGEVGVQGSVGQWSVFSRSVFSGSVDQSWVAAYLPLATRHPPLFIPNS